jgi:hypothetical protein
MVAPFVGVSAGFFKLFRRPEISRVPISPSRRAFSLRFVRLCQALGIRPGFYVRREIRLLLAMGRDADALAACEKAKEKYHLTLLDFRVLFARTLQRVGRVEEAKKVLVEACGRYPKVLRPLNELKAAASLPGDFDVARSVYMSSVGVKGPRQKVTHLIPVIDIASKLQLYPEALRLTEQALDYVMKPEFTPDTLGIGPMLGGKSKPGMPLKSAEAALRDLHDLMTKNGVSIFLISGTLLGVMREGRILGHDKDIDVGVIGSETAELIRSAIKKSGLFELQYIPSSDLIKVRHRTGVVIDIFFHYVEGDEVWHGSHLHQWVNSKWWAGEEPAFITVDYAGRSLLIPGKWELYLEENYGNWRVPQVKYDASLQAPNRRVRDRDKCRIHWRKLMMKYYGNADRILFGVAVGAYRKEFGNDSFVERLSRFADSNASIL